MHQSSKETIIKPVIIGEAYRELKKLVRIYAEDDLPVLFVGETGTGKEFLARLYMSFSKRKGLKKTVNCASYPDALLRSEIFGHVRGAYTDAIKDRCGKLKTCNGGVLFLDELGDASPDFQAAILRVSEGNSFSPLGSDEELKVDTRIIAATLKPEKIRRDLFMRFHILPVPSLQNMDIPALAESFCGGKEIKNQILDELIAREYPGNIRELKNFCEGMKAEKKDIFRKKGDSIRPPSVNHFDYSRYRQEWMAWHEHIQPILDTYNIKNFRFVFQHAEDTYTGQHYFDKPSDLNHSISVIHNLKRGNLKSEKEYEEKNYFEIDLNNYINTGTLSYLLKRLSTKNLSGYGSTSTTPSLSSLLDMSYQEAKDKFELMYLNHVINRNDGNLEQAAESIGMKPKSLKQKFDRLQKRHVAE